MNTPWLFPLKFCTGIPVEDHPGAFGVRRKHDTHTGVDLYTNENEPVYAVEGGSVVRVAPFTGPKDNSPWWLDTEYVLVEGASGVLCYGEIAAVVKVGDVVERGQHIANVQRVLREGKERSDIPGHRPCMLHFEWYDPGIREATTRIESWLRNPVDFLLMSGQLRVPPVLPLRK